MAQTEDIVVRRNDETMSYELLVDGVLAGGIDFEARPDAIALIHTHVDDAFAGRGLAKQLVQRVLAQLREEGIPMLPYCPYVRAYLDKHPEDVELVPLERRERFGLPTG